MSLYDELDQIENKMGDLVDECKKVDDKLDGVVDELTSLKYTIVDAMGEHDDVEDVTNEIENIIKSVREISSFVY